MKSGLIFLWAVLLCLSQLQAQAQPDSTNTSQKPNRKNTLDTTQVVVSPPDTTVSDSALVVGDSLVGDSVVIPVDPRQAYVDSLESVSDLKSQVRYKAKDSIIFDVPNDVLYLYGDVTIEYEKIKLTAAKVKVDWENQTIYADGTLDTAGQWIGLPVYSEGNESYAAKSMSYNFKSKKGRIIMAQTEEGDGILHAEVGKYTPDEVLCILNGKYTTCNADHPHFYIKAKKLKRLPNGKIISGPLNLIIEDFPLPIVIPFGFFPGNQETRKNGIIFPQYGEAQDRGFYLRNLGYYWGLNDYMDLLLEGDIYTKGGWRLGARTRYNKRYRFSGDFSLEYGLAKFGEREDPDFSRTTSWFVRWNHRQPINPTTNLTASVDIGSSRFLRQFSTGNDFFTNTLRSSVTFTKGFNRLPFNVTLSVNHSQDLNRETVNLKLPELNVAMGRQFPFKNLTGKNLDWLKQLGVSYSFQSRNELQNIPDSIFFPVLFQPGQLVPVENNIRTFVVRNDSVANGINYGTLTPIDTTVVQQQVGSTLYRNGMFHNIPVSTNIKLLKYVNISPNFNYREYWYFKTVRKRFNERTEAIEESDIRGFQTARDFNFSVNANTNFYMLYQLTKSKKEIVFRQRISPSIGYTYKPDFADPKWGFYDSVQVNLEGDMQQYSRFEDGIYGRPSAGESQSMNFGINSVLEMKYRKKESFEEDFDESQDRFNRISILDNLGISGNYNFAADSFKMSTISLSARTRLFKDKLNINGSATFDPYTLNAEGTRISTFEWQANKRLGRLTNTRLSLSTALKSKNKKDASKKSDEFDEVEYEQIQRQRDMYVDFNIPWTVRLSYDFSYSRPNLNPATIVQTVRLTGDVNLTEKWKIGVQTGYDFTAMDFSYTTVNVYRDLHCWEMSFQWTPFGVRQGFMLTLNVKSATLSDLRLTRRNDWRDRFTSF